MERHQIQGKLNRKPKTTRRPTWMSRKTPYRTGTGIIWGTETNNNLGYVHNAGKSDLNQILLLICYSYLIFVSGSVNSTGHMTFTLCLLLNVQSVSAPPHSSPKDQDWNLVPHDHWPLIMWNSKHWLTEAWVPWGGVGVGVIKSSRPSTLLSSCLRLCLLCCWAWPVWTGSAWPSLSIMVPSWRGYRPPWRTWRLTDKVRLQPIPRVIHSWLCDGG